MTEREKKIVEEIEDFKTDRISRKCRFCLLRGHCVSLDVYERDAILKSVLKQARYRGMSPGKRHLAILRMSIARSVLSTKLKPCFKRIDCSSVSSQLLKKEDTFSKEKS